jgi:hypothetical protein
MNKRNSNTKINGQILLMQNNLLAKLAGINDDKKCTDELGFPAKSYNDNDALSDLINRSKNIVNIISFSGQRQQRQNIKCSQ